MTAASYFTHAWDVEQWVGLALAVLSGTFVLLVLLWDRVKDTTPVRYLRDWTWKRHPRKRKRPRRERD
jgi:hypothetical protein